MRLPLAGQENKVRLLDLCTYFEQLIIITADILSPAISTFADGTAVAGQAFTLFCRVVLPEGLATRPLVVWFSPEGEVMVSGGELTVGNQQVVGNPSRLTTYMAQFSPVLTSHGGTYTCQATVSSPYGTIQQSVTAEHNVTVESKWVRQLEH